MSKNLKIHEEELDNLLNYDPDLEIDLDEIDPPLETKEVSSNCCTSLWSGTKRLTKRILGFQENQAEYDAFLKSKEYEEDELSDRDTGESTASWVSIILFMWFTPFMKLGRKRPLRLNDLGRLLPLWRPRECTEDLSAHWQSELDNSETRSPSFLRALWRTYRRSLFITGLIRSWRLTSGLSPLILKWVIEVIENPGSKPVWYGVGLVFTNIFIILIGVVMFEHYIIQVYKSEIQTKNAVSGLLYSKLLKLSASAKQSNIHGKLMNLIGSDIGRIWDLVWNVQFIWLTPALTLICFGSVIYVLGVYPALAGFAVMITIVPLSSLVSKKLETLRESQSQLTDARVRVTNEIFHTMKTVKVYALEEHLAKDADEARRAEMEAIRLQQLWRAFNESVNDGTIPLMTLASIFTFVLRGGLLTPSNVFSLVGIYGALHWPFFMITQVISSTVECLVSIRRIQAFLELPEKPGLKLVPVPEGEAPLATGEIRIKNSSFEWEALDIADLDSSEPEDGESIALAYSGPHLSDLTFSAPSGSLTCIVGPVGSGKSSLLNSLLGEMKQISGSVHLLGSIAYAPQIPTLIHATVRENITFGCDFEEEKYAKVIEACALKADFESLLAGDLTVIGERGINLSGGQKARIAMARAVYSDFDIILLDDPLSAVDAHVGHKLFNECIKGLLKTKTVLLVTHQLQYVNHGDQLVVMEQGRIKHFGTPTELQEAGIDLASLLEKFNSELNKHNSQDAHSGLSDSIDDDIDLQNSYGSLHNSHQDSLKTSFESLKNSSGASAVPGIFLHEESLQSQSHVSQLEFATSKANLTENEERGTGSISGAVYKFYFSKKLYWWILVVLVIFIHQALDTFVLTYLGRWTARNTPAMTSPGAPTANSMSFGIENGVLDATPQSEKVGPLKLSKATTNFLIVYGLTCVALVVSQMFKSTLTLLTSCWTGTEIYLVMFNKLLRAPMAFFDTTPKGRIAARCSNDTDKMDNKVGGQVSSVTSLLATILTCIMLVILSAGWWALLLIPLFLAYTGIWNRTIGTFRDLVRLSGNSNAPISTIFSESLNGLYTLRAFKRENSFVEQLYSKLETFTRLKYYESVCGTWINIRVESISALLTLSISLVGVLSRNINPGMMAMAVMYLLYSGDAITELLSAYSSLESNMNSVERIQQYTLIESERPAHIEGHAPPANWPSQGWIKFDKVSYRYRSGLPLVLNNIDFLIKPGEKVGVVGRTGAGKSSVLSALLSLAPLAGGKIIIDDEDISLMGVGDLRSRLSIIPQDPVIFEGSVRRNIDPFGNYGDDEIWNILRRIHLANAIEDLPKKLDSDLGEDGSNFSLGQRQLICVGRALLKRSKILLLDEASSSIDLETDYLLQQTLRSEFADCTTITIAHRLATIMDSDRVLVLDAGTVKEFDTPGNLLSNPNSLFFLLHQQTQSSSHDASLRPQSTIEADSSLSLI